MRIKQSDSERLVVVHFPWLGVLLGLAPVGIVIAIALTADNLEKAEWWTWLIAFAIAAPWLALCLFLAKKCTYDFDLRARQLNWSRKGVFGEKSGVLPFDQIRGAVVDIHSSSNSGPTYRPILQTSEGHFPLKNYYTGGILVKYRCQRLVDAINAALQTNSADALDDEILMLVSKGDRLAAIRAAQKRFGYDLAGAKLFIEELSKRTVS